MQHRGEIVEHAVRQSGMSLSELARRLGKSRRWIYMSFDNPALSIDTILQIGKVIHMDFSSLISELKNQNQQVSEPEGPVYMASDQSDVLMWKEKYLLLLEKYNELLEKYQRILENKS